MDPLTINETVCTAKQDATAITLILPSPLQKYLPLRTWRHRICNQSLLSFKNNNNELPDKLKK